jgi:hypothetical protein
MRFEPLYFTGQGVYTTRISTGGLGYGEFAFYHVEAQKKKDSREYLNPSFTLFCFFEQM